MEKGTFDVIYVTYNSGKWIDACFSSWKNIDFDLQRINIIVVDNASDDDTLEKLEMIKNKIGCLFDSFVILSNPQNLGFGHGNNIGFKYGNSEYVCFLNIDTELMPKSFTELEKSISSSEAEFGLWEFRQFPYEHPKVYNPVNGLSTWSSGAAFAVRREDYKKIDGFDERLFLYAEDVDLSWRLRSQGVCLKYCPNVVIKHYSYMTANQIKPNQYTYGIINNLLLRWKYGSAFDIAYGYCVFLKALLSKGVFEGSKKMLLTVYRNNKKNIKLFYKDRKQYKSAHVSCFQHLDYCHIRCGSFYYCSFPKQNDEVTVFLFAKKHSSIFSNTRKTIDNQTYQNYKLIILDIPDTGKWPELESLLEKVKGRYCCFVSEGDLLYSDHLETLLSNMSDNIMICSSSYYGTENEKRMLNQKKEEETIEEIKMNLHCYMFDVQYLKANLKNNQNGKNDLVRIVFECNSSEKLNIDKTTVIKNSTNANYFNE